MTTGIILALLTAGPAGAASEAVSPAQAMQVYRSVSQWVREGLPEQPATIEGVELSGAAVTLRLNGRILGRGQSAGDPGSHAWRATQLALREANESWSRTRPDNGESPLPLPLDSLALDLQVGGDMVPLTGGTFSAATIELTPGGMGLAARVGDRFEAVFPMESIERLWTPDTGLRMLAAKLNVPVDESLSGLRASHDFTPYRFPVSHIAQESPDDPPMFLKRGSRIVPRATVDTEEIRRLGERIARHLLTHRWAGEEPHGLLGGYRPFEDDYRPTIAEPEAQAITALALLRFAELPSVDPQLASGARALAVTVLSDLSKVTQHEEDVLAKPASNAPALGAALAALAAVHEAVGVESVAGPMAGLDAFASSSVQALAGLVLAEEADAELGPGEQAIAIYGLASGRRWWGGAGISAEALRERLGRLLAATPREELASLLPWALYAELELSGSGEIASAIAMRDARTLIWQAQLDFPDPDYPDADLDGGIVLNRGVAPLPTTQSLRPLSAMAVMMGEQRLTPEADLRDELPRVARGLRFIMQLQIGIPEATLIQNDRRAFGGIRSALWDFRMPLEANALALLTVVETLEAVDKRF